MESIGWYLIIVFVFSAGGTDVTSEVIGYKTNDDCRNAKAVLEEEYKEKVRFGNTNRTIDTYARCIPA